MNSDTLSGNARNLGGSLKQTAGDATGDTALQGRGAADQISGQLQAGLGKLRDAFGGGSGPAIDKARSFAKERPFATAALAGVVGLALLNTLRGR